ncbi:uncharacterized protein LOC119742738 [Patiria miniata]|uniref:Uncharacterized protein n=1 Tax=Patiria miniata TaxID=46514 RepID=A0A914BF16_PATMI|nr:uncharacterized protein LOC119742738 [Patiria miniata]
MVDWMTLVCLYRCTLTGGPGRQDDCVKRPMVTMDLLRAGKTTAQPPSNPLNSNIKENTPNNNTRNSQPGAFGLDIPQLMPDTVLKAKDVIYFLKDEARERERERERDQSGTLC